MRNILCIDIGTSNMKAALFNEAHEILDYYVLALGPPTPQTPSVWVEKFTEIIEKFARYIHFSKRESLTIVISGHGPSLVFLDKQHNVIHYVSWQSPEVLSLPDEPSFFIPQIAYVKNNKPEVYAHTALVLPPAEYLAFTLTEKKIYFVPHKNMVPYYWTHDSAESYQIAESIFPSPILSGDLIARASSTLAAQLDIRHAMVVAGGLDYLSAKLGADAIEENHIFQRSGTSTTFNIAVRTNEFSKSRENLLDYVQTTTTHKLIPTFLLPDFLISHFNIGYTIPFYNELYKIITKYFFLQDMSVEDIVIKLHTLKSQFSPAIQNLDKFFQHGTTNLKAIISYVNTNIDPENCGYAYLALLLHQVKKIANILQELLPGGVINRDTTFTVSGGHAVDHVLMQLQAKIVDLPLYTYKPVYTELRGNLYLGLHALQGHPSYHSIINSKVNRTSFHPRNKS